MKQYIVTILEQEEDFFISLMKSIDFIDFAEEDTAYDIPEFHKSIVRERIEKYGSNKSNYLTRKELNDKVKFQ